MSATVRVIASPESWIEGEAVRQLERTAELPGMRLAIGLPDLHPGRGSPIGAAFVSDSQVYPHLVGNDIGCGMSLWSLDIARTKAKRDKWAQKLDGMEDPWDGDAGAELESAGLARTAFDASLGTIGGGNHFAEIQRVEEVMDRTALASLGVDPDRLLLLVHSGSRGLGESILRAHTERLGAAGLPTGSEDFSAYVARHDHAVGWARVNRRLIATRIAEQIGARAQCLLDVCHNGIHPAPWSSENAWLHRKGAAPADEGPVVIPGSRGDFSYIVVPRGEAELSARSLAHGAGRKWTRGETKGRLAKRVSISELERTKLGSAVICEDKELLYEEAPQAYKNIDRVVRDLVDVGLARVAATLRPIVTYKTRRA
jgi:release factor H-coupled RctB family protein